MIIHNIISFNKGSILTKEMLENIDAYPKETLELFYSEHSDGIITGFDIEKDDVSGYFLTKGILKHRDRIFLSYNNILRMISSLGNLDIIQKLRLIYLIT